MAQFQWDPESYLELIREEVPDYDRLQGQVVCAAQSRAGRVLELGTGTGESARRVLEQNPRAHLVGIDASGEMLTRARAILPANRARLLVSRLEDPLPAGPFDLVVSVLAVHHLDGPGKADLFRRIASVLAPSGRFVLGDLVVPADPADAVTPVDGLYDKPSSVSEQMLWLGEAGLTARVAWTHRDVAVIVAERPATFMYMSRTVGVAELRQNLSQYLRQVQRGERLLVTDRNRPVAELGPPATSGAELDRLIAEGRVSRPLRRGLPRPLKLDGDPYSLSRALDEIRGER